MFSRPIILFRLLGFSVRVDASWLLLAVLITWSLAVGYFPASQPGLEPTAYWVMGLASLFGLAISIVLHELAHSLVARRLDMPVKGITLFIFGGVAEMHEEPHAARDELLVAIAGPAMSLALAALLALGTAVADVIDSPPVLVAGYLVTVNLILALFNLVPAYPLDGGRMLRAVLWAWKDDIVWATRIAAGLGAGFGLGLIALGLYSVATGKPLIGVWWFLIGLFVRAASASAFQHTLARALFAGQPVSRFMRRDPVAVPAGLPVDALVEDYIYGHHARVLPVTENGWLAGMVTVDAVKRLERARWPFTTVRDIMVPCTGRDSIDQDCDAEQALARLRQAGTGPLMVTRQGRLTGTVSLRDLQDYLVLTCYLGDDRRKRRAGDDAARPAPGRGEADRLTAG